MAGGGQSGCSERSSSRGEGSESEARPISETTLSSFDSIMGDQLMSRGVATLEWAMLAETPSSSLAGAASSIMSVATKKKVIVVIDASRESRLAMLWALSHIVHSSDILTLIHFLPSSPQKLAGVSLSRPNSGRLHTPQERPKVKACREKLEARPSELGSSLKMLCTCRRPEVEVEAMIVEGMDKGLTIVTQAKKLEADVLVLAQKKPSLLQRLLNQKSPNDEVIEYCIQNAECLTLAVRKKSKHMGGYLINSRWQKNFWLLA